MSEPISIDDLLRVIFGGAGGVVIQNLTINANTYTATNQVIGDNAVIDARTLHLPAPQPQRQPMITSNGVNYRRRSYCAPLDPDVAAQYHAPEPFEPDVWRRHEQGDGDPRESGGVRAFHGRAGGYGVRRPGAVRGCHPHP